MVALNFWIVSPMFLQLSSPRMKLYVRSKDHLTDLMFSLYCLVEGLGVLLN